MKAARFVSIVFAGVLIASPLGKTAYAVWPFSSDTSSTPTKSEAKSRPANGSRVSHAPRHAPEPSMMERMSNSTKRTWNGFTDYLTPSSKKTSKKTTNKIGVTQLQSKAAS